MKRKPCDKEHVKDLNLWPMQSVHFRYTKQTGDTYINAYAVVKMIHDLGLYRHASTLAARIAEVVKKD